MIYYFAVLLWSSFVSPNFCASDSAGFARWHCVQYKFTCLLTYLLINNNSEEFRQWSRWSSLLKQGIIAATDGTSRDGQAVTTCHILCVTTLDILRHCYITTSKECSTNSQILLIYCNYYFFQLQLLKILYKFIVIWLTYGRKKKVTFLSERHLYVMCW